MLGAMPGWIGPWELAILLIVVLLVFGPKRLPEMGRSLGKGMREFKHSITGGHDNDDEPKTVELTATAEEQHTPAAPRKRDTVG
jgi:sec-independent protein translocase protein TatA